MKAMKLMKVFRGEKSTTNRTSGPRNDTQAI